MSIPETEKGKTMSTIRISRLTGPRNIELTTLERPTPAAGEVLLDITAVGVCGSDVHFTATRASARVD